MNTLLTTTVMLFLPAQEPTFRTWDIDGVERQGLRTTDRLHYSRCLDSVKARVYDSRG